MYVAEKRVRREQERLERVVAEFVSSKPDSTTWYLQPGALTPAQAQGAASLTELQLHKLLMERYRAARTTPTARG